MVLCTNIIQVSLWIYIYIQTSHIQLNLNFCFCFQKLGVCNMLKYAICKELIHSLASAMFTIKVTKKDILVINPLSERLVNTALFCYCYTHIVILSFSGISRGIAKLFWFTFLQYWAEIFFCIESHTITNLCHDLIGLLAELWCEFWHLSWEINTADLHCTLIWWWLLIDWVKVSHPTRQKTGHSGNVLPSQSLGYYWENRSQKPEEINTKIYYN